MNLGVFNVSLKKYGPGILLAFAVSQDHVEVDVEVEANGSDHALDHSFEQEAFVLQHEIEDNHHHPSFEDEGLSEDVAEVFGLDEPDEDVESLVLDKVQVLFGDVIGLLFEMELLVHFDESLGQFDDDFPELLEVLHLVQVEVRLLRGLVFAVGESEFDSLHRTLSVRELVFIIVQLQMGIFLQNLLFEGLLPQVPQLHLLVSLYVFLDRVGFVLVVDVKLDSLLGLELDFGLRPSGAFVDSFLLHELPSFQFLIDRVPLVAALVSGLSFGDYFFLQRLFLILEHRLEILLLRKILLLPEHFGAHESLVFELEHLNVDFFVRFEFPLLLHPLGLLEPVVPIRLVVNSARLQISISVFVEQRGLRERWHGRDFWKFPSLARIDLRLEQILLRSHRELVFVYQSSLLLHYKGPPWFN